MVALDSMDKRILDVLQHDGRIANQALAKRVGLSPSPCWRRVQRLQDLGVIEQQVTLLNAEAIGLDVVAFLSVSLDNHHPETVDEFMAVVDRCDEVLECYMMSGRNDFLLKVVAASIPAYQQFLSDNVLRCRGLRAANTSFVLGRRKLTTALPLAQE
jgi:DNA-binding Lrp family transcriptional regulator